MREFKKGDRVTEKDYGTGVVASIIHSQKWPVYVEFDNGKNATFTEDGRYTICADITLFHADPDPDPAPAPRKPYAIPANASQEDKILAHIFHVGSISPIEAQELCGSMCLAQRIYELKKRYNIEFVRVMEKHTLPNGHTGTHTRYSMPEVIPYEFQRKAWDLVGVTF